MSLIDFILNLAGLLLWVSWRSIPFDPFNKRTPATLAGTLRRAEPTRFRVWYFLVALVLLLLVRGVFYWWVGGALDWTPGLRLGPIEVYFRNGLNTGDFWRMMLFSGASFLHTLVIFYLWMILLSLATPRNAEVDSCQRFIRAQLGVVHSWWAPFRLSLPLAGGFAVWLAVGRLLSTFGIIPPAKSFLHQAEQGFVLGLGTYLVWKYAIATLLALYLLNSYLYLGQQPLWNFVNTSARRLLTPLRKMPLRVGKVDFSPVVGIAAVFILARFLELGLHWQVPLLKVQLDIPGLMDLYRSFSN